MTFVSGLACLYFALVQHDYLEEREIHALIKAASEPFLPGLFAKTLANVNLRSLTCNRGAGGSDPAADAAPTGCPAGSISAAPAEKKVEEKKEESEESDDDTGFSYF